MEDTKSSYLSLRSHCKRGCVEVVREIFILYSLVRSEIVVIRIALNKRQRKLAIQRKRREERSEATGIQPKDEREGTKWVGKGSFKGS